MLVRMWRKGNPLTLLVGMQAGAATLENSMDVPQKVKKRATLQSSNCTMRYLSNGYEHSDLKGTCTPMFIAAMYTTAKYGKSPDVHQQMNG